MRYKRELLVQLIWLEVLVTVLKLNFSPSLYSSMSQHTISGHSSLQHKILMHLHSIGFWVGGVSKCKSGRAACNHPRSMETI